MLRFNSTARLKMDRPVLFQYILCYGSTLCCQCFLFAWYISIHPMLRFNHWCYVIYIFYHTGKRLIQQVFIKIFPMTGIFFRKEQKIGFDICVSGLLFSCLYFIIGKYKMIFSFCVFAVINYPSNHF